MTAIAIALLIALIVTNAVWLMLQARLYNEFARERRELLNRIQHPEVRIPEGVEQMIPDEELLTAAKDEYALVGTIQTQEPEQDGR